MSLNRTTIAIFSPILMLAGIAGFFVPAEHSLTSGAAPYNVFHLVFGVLGLLVLWSRNELFAAFFNIGFGLIDLYQALASYLSWPPKEYFLWTKVDDILHVIIGLVLLSIGTYGILNLQEKLR